MNGSVERRRSHSATKGALVGLRIDLVAKNRLVEPNLLFSQCLERWLVRLGNSFGFCGFYYLVVVVWRFAPRPVRSCHSRACRCNRQNGAMSHLFLARDRIGGFKLHRGGKLQGLNIADNLKEFQNPPPRLAKRGGYTGLMEGSGRGESMDWA
ncbi:MAG: hypothetical protein CM1200mP29_13310 [Verrucomicrobiota bacterium]|nr:MAG: hypothetical protein CM1200mP29_13310 [Verrucomicrobiota bacterium]